VFVKNKKVLNLIEGYNFIDGIPNGFTAYLGKNNIFGESQKVAW
jgi:hypothetical protein